MKKRYTKQGIAWKNIRKQWSIKAHSGYLIQNGMIDIKCCIIPLLQFDKRNGSKRIEVVQDAIQIANIADLVSSKEPHPSATYIFHWMIPLLFPPISCGSVLEWHYYSNVLMVIPIPYIIINLRYYESGVLLKYVFTIFIKSCQPSSLLNEQSIQC